mmetsp:Transcript_34400/g.110555  ORF Transcript_34400/g.110555 Transcript_34400/m.110555 type:complete len:374 (-) Transcript_34400:1028-2149(-)
MLLLLSSFGGLSGLIAFFFSELDVEKEREVRGGDAEERLEEVVDGELSGDDGGGPHGACEGALVEAAYAIFFEDVPGCLGRRRVGPFVRVSEDGVGGLRDEGGEGAGDEAGDEGHEEAGDGEGPEVGRRGEDHFGEGIEEEEFDDAEDYLPDDEGSKPGEERLDTLVVEDAARRAEEGDHRPLGVLLRGSHDADADGLRGARADAGTDRREGTAHEDDGRVHRFPGEGRGETSREKLEPRIHRRPVPRVAHDRRAEAQRQRPPSLSMRHLPNSVERVPVVVLRVRLHPRLHHVQWHNANVRQRAPDGPRRPEEAVRQKIQRTFAEHPLLTDAPEERRRVLRLHHDAFPFSSKLLRRRRRGRRPRRPRRRRGRR